MQNLRERYAAVYGGVASDYLIGYRYYSRNAPDGQEETAPYNEAYKDIFVDADNLDFHIRPDCLAVSGIDVAHMSWEGKYIGAKSEAYKVALSDMNLTNIDSLGNIIDQETDASAVQNNILDLGKDKKITSLTAFGARAKRNGQQVNSEPTIGTVYNPGDTLPAGNYIVMDGVVTLDTGDIVGDVSFDEMEYFRIDDSQSFSSGTGVVKEILIHEDYQEKIKVKSSRSDSSLSSATEITLYLNEEPTVNYDANGEPVAGNADATFDPAKAEPLNARYIQVNVQVKANNIYEGR